MKSYLKVISLLVSVFMVAAVFAGCSGNKPAASSSSASSSAPQFDLGGKTISYVAWWDGTPQTGTPLGDLQNQRLTDLEKKYNFKLEFDVISADQVVSKFTAAAMAGSSLGDIIVLRNYWLQSMIQKNELMPLNGLFDYTQSNVNTDVTKLTTVNGKTYGFLTGSNGVGFLTFFNKNIFSRENLPDPYQLYSSGKWTWSEFETICQKVAQDNKGSNGVPTVWGSGCLDQMQQIAPMVYGFGGSFLSFDKDGNPVSGLIGQGVLNCLTYIHKLTFVEKTCEQTPKTVTWDYSLNQFSKGKYAMLLMGQFACQTLKQANMSDPYGVVPLPKDAGMSNYINYLQEINVNTIPATEDPDLAKKVAIIWQQYNATYPGGEKLEEQQLAQYTCDSQSVQVIMGLQNAASTIGYENGYNTPLWGTVVPALTAACQGTKTPTAAMSGVNQAWQAAIKAGPSN